MVTLIRHGQAGSRVRYDDLSDVGREQARALGAWLREQGRGFDRIVSGGLVRQQITAQEMARELGANPGLVPELTVDERWSEFDLDQVYAGIAPLLSREDGQFGREYEELQHEIADPESSAHRAWRNCDVTVVRAWIGGRFEFEGESFQDFSARVGAALRDLRDRQTNGLHIAVVTSATPIALCAGAALDLSPRRVMQLAGALRNTSFSEMELRGDVRLISFNNLPHLRDERLRTLR